MNTRPASYPDPASIPALAPLIEKENDENFAVLLGESLRQAKDVAASGDPANGVAPLDPLLFAALEWPANFSEYVGFLVRFAYLIPRQSRDRAWLDPGSPLGEHQEVYDRLCHFYWLIDQPAGPDGGVVQDIPWFREWLVGYANVWGEFLDSTDSFNDDILDSFRQDSLKYRLEDSMIGTPPRPNAPSGWLTFNQFFARELNPGLRPITDPGTNTTVTAPADCTYKEHFDIGLDSSIPGITLKGTHTYANVKDLLAGSKYADSFAGGQFVHFFLGPYSYHRFHTPVAGLVKECYPVQGKVYLKVQLGGGQFQAYDASSGGYEFAQARGILTVDTSGSPFGDVGVVAAIPVGMCQVSGVNMTHEENTECLKGDEFGYFTFGGSDIIVLFQKGTNPQYNPQFVPGTTYYSLYGSEIAQATRPT